MTDQTENETTEKLPPLPLEKRVATLEATLQTALFEINSKLDALVKMQQEMLNMQQEMYVDLRGRIVAMDNKLFTMSNTIHQIQLDIQPDSFQNRLMRMGQ